MNADECRRSSLHGIHIERLHDVPHIASQQRGRLAAVQRHIHIASGQCAEACVKSSVRLICSSDPNVRRELAIQRRGHPRDFKLRICGEADHLSQRMNSCVGATRPVRRDLLTKDMLHGLLDLALHRSEVRLVLEACEVGAIIFNDEAEPPWSYFRRPNSPRRFITTASLVVAVPGSMVSLSMSSRTTMGAPSPRRAPILVILE